MLVSTAQRRAISQRQPSVSHGVSTQTANAAQEDSEAVRAIAFLRQMRCHASSAFNLLNLGASFLTSSEGLRQIFGLR